MLTYSEGRFIFKDASFSDLAMLDRKIWRPIDVVDFATTDIRAAVQFRKRADFKAEKIFNRAFVKRYSLSETPLPDFLDDHQISGVCHILSRSRSYLAHAPGAGKTLQALTAACFTGGRALFIVPPSLVENWHRELLKWLPKFYTGSELISISRCTADEPDFEGCDVLLVSDSMLTRPHVLKDLKAFGPEFIAIDEASRFKEAESNRTRALFGGVYRHKGKEYKSSGLVYDAKHVVLLDGSPMPNRAMELWAPTYAMSPESIDFMDQVKFGFKFCGARMNDRGNWEYKGTNNYVDLKARLTKTFMHTVLESDLDHPERLRKMIFLPEMKTKTARKLTEWGEQFIKRINFKDLTDADSQGEMATLRKELGLAKAKRIAEYTRERLEKGEQVLLFLWHREVADLMLTKYLYDWNPGFVIGGVSAGSREHDIKRFKDGKTQLLIGNILAMGRGHNIQEGDRAIFGEYSWSDETNKQCEKRLSRMGSTKLTVPCDYLVVANTFDEYMLSNIFRKERDVKRVIG